jgi:hypothetical protein
MKKFICSNERHRLHMSSIEVNVELVPVEYLATTDSCFSTLLVGLLRRDAPFY